MLKRSTSFDSGSSASPLSSQATWESTSSSCSASTIGGSVAGAVSSSSANGASPYVVQGLSLATERDSEHSASKKRAFTSIICPVVKKLKLPSRPSHFESALIFFYLLITESFWLIPVYYPISWAVPSFLTIVWWYYLIPTLSCVYEAEDWTEADKKTMSLGMAMGGVTTFYTVLLTAVTGVRVPTVFLLIFCFLDIPCIYHSIRAFHSPKEPRRRE